MFEKGFEVQKDEELIQDISESVIHSLIHLGGNVKHWKKHEIQTRNRIAVYQVGGEEEKKTPDAMRRDKSGLLPKHNNRPTRWAEYTALYSAR
jgi:hypothetical protein